MNAINSVESFDYECIISTCIVEEGESASIIQLEDQNGNVIYHVIAGIVTDFLPEAAEFICNKTVGDPDICATVYDATSILTILPRGKIYRGIKKGLQKSFNYIVKKDKKKSTALIKTDSYKSAQGIKDMFASQRKACEKNDGIPWESIGYQEPDDFENMIALDNSTESFISFQLSIYGVEWEKFEIQEGYSQSYSISSVEDGCFIKINNKTGDYETEMKLESFKRYKIKYNTSTEKYEIIEL